MFRPKAPSRFVPFPDSFRCGQVVGARAARNARAALPFELRLLSQAKGRIEPA